MAYLYFVIVCLLFGSNFILMDRAAAVLGPLSVAVARLLGGAAVLLVAVFLSQQRPWVDRRTLSKLLLVSLLANAYPFAIQPWLLQQGVDHSFLAVFVAFTPLLTIVVAIPMLGVRPTWQQVVGVLGGLGLLAWIAGDAETHHLRLGLLPVVLTVPLAYAIGNTFLRRQLQDVPAMVAATLLLALAGMMLLPLAAAELTTSPPQATSAQWLTALAALLVLGPLGTGACIGMFVHLVQDRGPLFAGMVTYFVPLVALVWGYHDGETISTVQVAGIFGILAMVALVQSSQANYRNLPGSRETEAASGRGAENPSGASQVPHDELPQPSGSNR